MTVETVVVNMTRTDKDTIWGFRLQGGREYSQPLCIAKITEGCLADRAGLKVGDTIMEIDHCKAETLAHFDAQQRIINCGNRLDLVISRNISTIWSPSFPQVENIKTTVVHRNGSVKDLNSTPMITANNVTPAPFRPSSIGQRIELSKTCSPLVASSNPVPFVVSSSDEQNYKSSSYSKKTTTTRYQTSDNSVLSPDCQKSPADAYLKNAGGSFRTDTKIEKSDESQPAYLRSETLKLIREEQRSHNGKTHHFDHLSPTCDPIQQISKLDGAPICENCQQPIIGVFCKAGGKPLHAECFTCSTCGASLKNIGYFLFNEKFYCELHAKHQRNSTITPSSAISPDTNGRSDAARARSSEIRAFSSGPKTTKDFNSTPKSYLSTTVTSMNMKSVSDSLPKTYSSSSFIQNRNVSSEANMNSSAAAGDGIQMFGPKTPNRAKGILTQLQEGPRIPVCEFCQKEIRGPFVLALSKSWCPNHFVCGNKSCNRPLIDVGFIEQNGENYCEFCFETHFAPNCAKCSRSITGECLTALHRQWHPECFTCSKCHQPFGNASFFLENGKPYCETDWNNIFTTKCISCQFPIEAGDRWVEALGQSFHADCFSCTICQKTLEGQSFYSKGGRPFCKLHA